MDRAFWHQRWAEGRIGFHKPTVNPNLARYIDALDVAAGDRVFVPLCGKSLDLPWLAARGFEPVGVELIESAVAALFAEHGIEPTVASTGGKPQWRGGGMTVFCGDCFALAAADLGPVAAAWDRAALIALPATMRAAYVEHCAHLLPAGARLLLVTMAYADDGVAGPPFAVPPAQVETLYAPWFHVAGLTRDVPVDAPGDLAVQGVAAVYESVWLLTRNQASANPRQPQEESRP